MTAKILSKDSTLTLSLAARDTSESNEIKRLYLEVDQALVERLRVCVAEADRLDVRVTLVVWGGFEYGATNRNIAVRVTGNGQMDVIYEWGGNTKKTFTFVTGGLHVSMIEEALEKVATLPGQAGVGFMPDTAEFLLLVAHDRIEKTDHNTLAVRPKPEPEAETIFDQSDAVICAPVRPVNNNAAVHILVGADGSISMRD